MNLSAAPWARATVGRLFVARADRRIRKKQLRLYRRCETNVVARASIILRPGGNRNCGAALCTAARNYGKHRFYAMFNVKRAVDEGRGRSRVGIHC